MTSRRTFMAALAAIATTPLGFSAQPATIEVYLEAT